MYNRDFINPLQNSNVLHGDPNRPPVTNPSGILINRNMAKTLLPL